MSVYSVPASLEPSSNLDDFLAQLEYDDRLVDAKQMAGSLPAEEVEEPDVPLTPLGLAELL